MVGRLFNYQNFQNEKTKLHELNTRENVSTRRRLTLPRSRVELSGRHQLFQSLLRVLMSTVLVPRNRFLPAGLPSLSPGYQTEQNAMNSTAKQYGRLQLRKALTMFDRWRCWFILTFSLLRSFDWNFSPPKLCRGLQKKTFQIRSPRVPIQKGFTGIKANRLNQNELRSSDNKQLDILFAHH